MTVNEILYGSGGVLLLLLTLLQIAPIRINPWSAIARAIGRALNSEVLKELADVRSTQQVTAKKLDDHIAADEVRHANRLRERILQFNNELLRNIPHTREDFIEILAVIDAYNSYCRTHEDYQNNRAIHAIKNIERVYDDRLAKRDFLQA